MEAILQIWKDIDILHVTQSGNSSNEISGIDQLIYGISEFLIKYIYIYIIILKHHSHFSFDRRNCRYQLFSDLFTPPANLFITYEYKIMLELNFDSRISKLNLKKFLNATILGNFLYCITFVSDSHSIKINMKQPLQSLFEVPL